MLSRGSILLCLLGVILLPSALLAQNRTPAVQPHRVTLQTSRMSLHQALRAVAEQTGISVGDRRRQNRDEKRLQLDVRHATFWEALDSIAQAANAQVSLYQAGTSIAIVDGPYRAVPTSYSGLFRIQLRRIEMNRDFQSEMSTCRLNLEIAWEPGFQPLFLQTGLKPLAARTEHGTPLPAIGAGTGREAVSGERIFTELPLVLTAPPRSATKLARLQGEVALIGPSRIVTFTFADLVAGMTDKAKERPKQTQDGITVSLRRFEIEPGTPPHWNVGFTLQYPATGPAFDTFESWLVTSRLRLVRKGNGGKRFLAPASYSDDMLPGHRANFDYTFTPTRGLRLDQPRDWKLVYRVPGPMVSLPVPFTFRNVPLP